MNTTMRAMLIASLALAFTACKKEEAAPVDEAKQALVAPAKDDDAGWKKYLQEVAIQNMGNITNSPFLYYLSPESDPDFQAKYERQTESATRPWPVACSRATCWPSVRRPRARWLT